MDMNAVRLTRDFLRRAEWAAAFAVAKAHLSIEVRGRGGPSETKFCTSDELIEHHFATWSFPAHPDRSSLADTLRLLDERPAVILETGSSACGTNSSQLFDAYVRSFGGEFATVDLRLRPTLKLRPILSEQSTLACGDSVAFLERWVKRNPSRKADLVYLDSWDLDAADPVPSATHCLREFFAIHPALRDGSLLLVDDTPSSLDLYYSDEQRSAAAGFYERHGKLPGKGMLLDLFLANHPRAEKIHHGYQVLYRLK
jgi:hypothetical protein